MKPNITKDSEGRYWCTIPDEQEPTGDGATTQDWWDYMACGCGWSPVEAYTDWILDCVWEDKE